MVAKAFWLSIMLCFYHILSTVQACLVSEDRARVLAALEMLNKLSQNEANDDVLLRALDPKVYMIYITCLVSEDRARVLAALEMLNKLSQNEANDDVLLRALDPKIYSDVCSLLTLRDIMALVSCLECVYSLTSLGERACEQVASSTGTLVALLTVEAQSYGPQACILMRVVETVSGAADTAPAQDKAHAAQAESYGSQACILMRVVETHAAQVFFFFF
ncbi:unnamed protein product [Plutella xylostella]|uniref:(diamondback moth) hypothetical protein n=1 Tax=Plutella xylostella TaxID=51655 RepID=A0A8S4FMQ2_PLUXY|nr:unnamed protein product [Plutella xylostella]